MAAAIAPAQATEGYGSHSGYGTAMANGSEPMPMPVRQYASQPCAASVRRHTGFLYGVSLQCASQQYFFHCFRWRPIHSACVYSP